MAMVPACPRFPSIPARGRANLGNLRGLVVRGRPGTVAFGMSGPRRLAGPSWRFVRRSSDLKKKLWKAKQSLGVVSRKAAFGGQWQWSLPAQDFQVSLPAEERILGIFEGSSSEDDPAPSLSA